MIGSAVDSPSCCRRSFCCCGAPAGSLVALIVGAFVAFIVGAFVVVVFSPDIFATVGAFDTFAGVGAFVVLTGVGAFVLLMTSSSFSLLFLRCNLLGCRDRVSPRTLRTSGLENAPLLEERRAISSRQRNFSISAIFIIDCRIAGSMSFMQRADCYLIPVVAGSNSSAVSKSYRSNNMPILPIEGFSTSWWSVDGSCKGLPPTRAKRFNARAFLYHSSIRLIHPPLISHSTSNI